MKLNNVRKISSCLTFLFLLLYMNNCFPNQESTTVKGSLFIKDMENFGISDIGVNPFFAYWKILFINSKSVEYTQTVDVNGCFSIQVPNNESYAVIFLDPRNNFQFQLTYKPLKYKKFKAPVMMRINNKDEIDLGIITKIDSYGVLSDNIGKIIEVDNDYFASDENENLIPDGLETNRQYAYFYGKKNTTDDLDNDGIKDDIDLDIDGDGILNAYDDDIDEDGLRNEDDSDNTNDGVKDNIGPMPPEIKLDSKTTSEKGLLIFNFTLTDENADEVSLKIKYSIDSGKNYRIPSIPNSETEKIKATPEGIKHSIKWNTIADLGYINQKDILFEIQPVDKNNEGIPIKIKLDVQNNTPPSCELISPKNTSLYGSVNIEWKITEPDPKQENYSSLFFSPDKINYILIADNLKDTSFTWDTIKLAKIKKIWFRIVVNDPFSNTEIVSAKSYSLDNPDPVHETTFVIPNKANQIFSDKIEIRWDSPQKGISDLSWSSDGITWKIITSSLSGNYYSWDISGFKNTKDIRLMLKTTINNYIYYSFSNFFIIKNKNHPPVIEVIYPSDNSVIGGITEFKLNITDIDPADNIKNVVISCKKNGAEELIKLAEFNNNPERFPLDLFNLDDADSYTFIIIASDDSATTSKEISKVSVINPPVLKNITVLSDNELILDFSKPVINLFLNTDISNNIKVISIEKLSEVSFKFSVSPSLQSGIAYNIFFKNDVTDLKKNKILPYDKSFSLKTDEKPPEIIRLFPIDYHLLDIVYSEPVKGADIINNYKITPELNIKSIIDLGDNSYRLITEDHKENETYCVDFANITDDSGNKIVYTKPHTVFSGYGKNKYIKVDINGKGDFTDIDTAITKSIPGSIILISGGTYKQINSTLYHPVTIWGGINPQTWLPDTEMKTIIESDNPQYCAITSSTNARIINLYIKNGSDGIRINKGYNLIYGCKIYDNKDNGITLTGNSQTEIINCVIEKNGHDGIAHYSDKPAYICNNVIIDNIYHGIEIYSSTSTGIFNNILMRNEYGISIRRIGENYPQIKNNCFFNNNHGKSLESSYCIFLHTDTMIQVINEPAELNQNRFGWTGNFVHNPNFMKNNYSALNDSFPLMKSGIPINIAILPEYLSARIKPDSPPVGIIQDKN